MKPPLSIGATSEPLIEKARRLLSVKSKTVHGRGFAPGACAKEADRGAQVGERREGFAERAVPVGRRFAVADLLIAAIAVGNHLAIGSLDRDFAAMAALGFVLVHAA